MTQRMTDREYSIKQLRSQLEYLTNELNKTTEQIQLLEIFDNSKTETTSTELESDQEISELIKKQNIISYEIITIKKNIQKLSAKTILKAELLILPVVVVLLFLVATNYSIQPTEQDAIIKTHYEVEDLQGDITNNYRYWNLMTETPLMVNIKNSANTNDQKIQDVKNAIMSTDGIMDDNQHNSELGSKSEYFRGWTGALDKIPINTIHQIPKKINLVKSNNVEGNIVVTLSAMKSQDGYSGVTRIIADGNKILKAFITIYDSNNLSDSQLESIVRQGFGHALGLPNTDNQEDLMHEFITTNHSYISDCDIKALQKLYDDEKLSKNFCNA